MGAAAGLVALWGSLRPKGTDLGLADLEILIVTVDDSIFGAAGPDETDALRLEQIN